MQKGDQKQAQARRKARLKVEPDQPGSASAASTASSTARDGAPGAASTRARTTRVADGGGATRRRCPFLMLCRVLFFCCFWVRTLAFLYFHAAWRVPTCEYDQYGPYHVDSTAIIVIFGARGPKKCIFSQSLLDHNFTRIVSRVTTRVLGWGSNGWYLSPQPWVSTGTT